MGISGPARRCLGRQLVEGSCKPCVIKMFLCTFHATDFVGAAWTTNESRESTATRWERVSCKFLKQFAIRHTDFYVVIEIYRTIFQRGDGVSICFPRWQIARNFSCSPIRLHKSTSSRVERGQRSTCFEPVADSDRSRRAITINRHCQWDRFACVAACFCHSESVSAALDRVRSFLRKSRSKARTRSNAAGRLRFRGDRSPIFSNRLVVNQPSYGDIGSISCCSRYTSLVAFAYACWQLTSTSKGQPISRPFAQLRARARSSEILRVSWNSFAYTSCE